MTVPTSPDTGRRSWRRGGEWLLAILAVATVVAVPLLVWGRLPDPMAVHWGPSGAPDGFLPRWIDLLAISAVTVLATFGPLLSARGRVPRAQARLLVAVASGTGGLFAALRVVTVRANLDADSWDAAGDVTLTAFLAALAVAAVLAGLGAWLAGDRPDVGPAATAVAPIEQAGAQTVWSGSATGGVAVLLPLLALVVTGLGAWLVPGGGRIVVLLVLPVVAVLGALLGQVRVVVGPRGLTAGLGWFGWPRLRVPIGDVTDVTVEDVAPMAYGGWGLRTVPGATAVVVRAGAGIRIERRSGRALVVTVDDAARGAGVLLAHRDRAVTGSAGRAG